MSSPGNTSKLDANQILLEIRAGNEAVISMLYKQFGPVFLQWAKTRLNLDRYAAEDIFQDAVIEFYFTVSKDRNFALTCTVKTYLFSIARNKAANWLKKNNRTETWADTDWEEKAITSTNEASKEEEEEQREQVAQILQTLKEPCFSVLKLYYLQSFSQEAIAQRLGYKGGEVVKAIKARCLKSIRERLADKPTRSKS